MYRHGNRDPLGGVIRFLVWLGLLMIFLLGMFFQYVLTAVLPC
jgi:hypothetical protein